MTKPRLPYYELSGEALEGFRQIKHCLEDSSLGLVLIELVYLRISQINGCSFCLNMHAKSLRDQGESSERIDALAGWRVSHLFSAREKAALTWAESVTDIANSHAEDRDYLPLKDYFSDKEISDLTFAIALMNGLNRVAVSMRQ
ncbi:carboxymuconolactone decarboxylase family protein [Zooshikella harenae]|uniref:Carboxymuconolactone decarboxylase family protein n=1 Tax=Zooshikella harenae TaxID=2827238 RepID=A0ABS5ZCI6_9GAMM|nr:carboxymuconolactone decarboxylase family protein [Zooshikella harenae]MBU2711773.1 carboxymuconolactone decarboxylase family protein [Zooshikella harenae]